MTVNVVKRLDAVWIFLSTNAVMRLVVDLEMEVLSSRCVPHCARVCARALTRSLFVEHAVRREGALPVCSQRAGAARSSEGQTPQPGRFSSSPHPLLLHPFALSCPLTPLAERQAEEEGIYKSPQPPPPPPPTIYHDPLHLPICRWQRRGEAGGGV